MCPQRNLPVGVPRLVVHEFLRARVLAQQLTIPQVDFDRWYPRLVETLHALAAELDLMAAPVQLREVISDAEVVVRSLPALSFGHRRARLTGVYLMLDAALEGEAERPAAR